MLCSSCPPWLDHCNYVWGSVQVIKLLVTIFFNLLLFHPSLLHIISSVPCSQILSVCVVNVLRYLQSVLLMLRFYTADEKMKDSELNGSKHYLNLQRCISSREVKSYIFCNEMPCSLIVSRQIRHSDKYGCG
jgi:hypothetical protein